MKKEKVLLAFSGGLDTSFCVKYLAGEKGLEVHTAIASTGGFSSSELEFIRQRAISLGVVSHTVLDVEREYFESYIRYMIYGNILKNNTYPLSVSSERTVQAMAIARHAIQTGVRYVAHGSTAAGNDQVRFDLTFSTLAPQLQILTPIRDLGLSRDEEIDYLKQRGVDADWSQMAYSINKGLWGTSIGGRETNTSSEYLPEEAWPSQLQKTSSELITLQFVRGEVIGVNNNRCSGPEAIRAIQQLAAPYAIGRDIHTGDTIIGIKGRVAFEAAAPLIIIKAHHTLEKHVLTKWQLYWKEQLANWYGMLLHEAQYLDPVMRNIETFLTDTQQTVNGTVTVRLSPYRFEVLGIDSPDDLLGAGFGTYGEMNNGWSADEVRGFVRILGNSLRTYQHVHSNHNTTDYE